MQTKLTPYVPDPTFVDRYPTYEPELPPDSLIQFNTGRLYQADGQIIVALYLDYGRVLFNDVSRGIDGLIQLTEYEQEQIASKPNNAITLAKFIMSHYDYGSYTHIPSILRPFRPSRDNDRLTYMVR